MKFAADKYYLYEEMKELLEGWAKQYPGVLRLFSIGQSWCGREIPAVALTFDGIEEEKPGVLFDGGIHSREFVGSSVVLYALFIFWIINFFGCFFVIIILFLSFKLLRFVASIGIFCQLPSA